jgi:hypothetical protein
LIWLASARARLILLALALVAVLIGAAVWRNAGGDRGAPAGDSTTSEASLTGGRFERVAYEGLGAWVDVFDYAPQYQNAGLAPPVTPDDVGAMAAFGVRTLYLQAARLDDRSPEGIVDDELIGAFLARAHGEGIRVVGWYLPKHGDHAADLDRLLKIARFEWEGHRFDGLTVDIEDVETVTDVRQRNQRVVELSRALRAELGPDAVIGAGVLPPVQIEVINPAYWPGFPWAEIAPYYDVWLPMAYWSVRAEDSGWKDGYRYVVESVNRLRANLGQPDAVVHPIGGIGDGISEDDGRDYLRSLTATDALGGSIYDYRTMAGGLWGVLRGGIDAALAAPPSSATEP